jgi:hypothetical protein
LKQAPTKGQKQQGHNWTHKGAKEEAYNGKKDSRVPKEDCENACETYHPKESFKVSKKLN